MAFEVEDAISLMLRASSPAGQRTQLCSSTSKYVPLDAQTRQKGPWVPLLHCSLGLTPPKHEDGLGVVSFIGLEASSSAQSRICVDRLVRRQCEGCTLSVSRVVPAVEQLAPSAHRWHSASPLIKK
jgi:hypothetical protein